MSMMLIHSAVADNEVIYDPTTGIVHMPKVLLKGDESGRFFTVDMENNNGIFIINNIIEDDSEVQVETSYIALNILDFDGADHGEPLDNTGIMGFIVNLDGNDMIIEDQSFQENTDVENNNDQIQEESEQLFDQDTNEEEDFEIPAFLRKQKF